MTGVLAREQGGSEELSPTPRGNRNLPLVLADFQTLADGLDYAARGVTGFNFYSARGSLQHVLPYAQLRRQAISTARKLLSLGLKRGDRVAVVAETGPEFVTVFFACQYAGLIRARCRTRCISAARTPTSNASRACSRRRRPAPW